MSIVLKVTLSLLPTLLFCESFTHKLEEKNVAKKSKIRCRLVCDKKIDREEEIQKAISFYKNSKYYNFEYKKEKF